VIDTFVVTHEMDRIWAARRAVDTALRLGLGRRGCAELAVIVCELVTNAVKFAGSGVVTMVREGDGLQVWVEDSGPGVTDPERAVLDGYSEGAMRTPDDDPRKRRGLGSGLAAVKRFADDLQITRPTGGGTRVVAVKRLGSGGYRR
jgi:serine/threonine-protein kinase RsbT